MQEYIIPGSLLLFCIGGLVVVKVELAKRPTFDQANKKYKEENVCDEVHKRVDEKLECIPGMEKRQVRIETKLDILIENGKK